ncbi:MAG: hypothetical protein FJ098_12180, partial [Deltaproteobacteria bacterium]|nr:hypothetical protein [Deltaproteobacteria bacterium]
MRRVMMILAALAVLGTSLVVLGGLPEDPPATTPGDEVVPLAGTNPDGEAPVTLTVVPTARELDPVAVPELLCEGGDADICQSIRETLARDLGLSAFFTVLPAQSYLADMGEETLQRTKWDDWF